MSGRAPTAELGGIAAADALLQGWVDDGTLAGASYAVLRGGEPAAQGRFGWADREAGLPMAPDTVCRAFSNTKLFTSVALLRLLDQGAFDTPGLHGLAALDAPAARWLPALGTLRVLRPGARSLDDTEPLARPITLRHLLTHTAGFSHGVFDPGSLLFAAYQAQGVRRPDTTLAELVERLAALPLGFQPGSAWDYSAATDVLARLVEVVSGQRFGAHLQQALCAPLGLVDTGFVLREDQRPRWAGLYGVPAGAEALAACSQRLDPDVPYPGAWLRPWPRESGAGGLITTQDDMLRLLRALLPGDPGGCGWLRPDTLAAMFSPQLPEGLRVQFTFTGPLPALSFGLAGAVSVAEDPRRLPPAGQGGLGLLQWGGLAGTHWWIAPQAAGGRGLAGALMTQRMMGFWQPWWWRWLRAVHAALG